MPAEHPNWRVLPVDIRTPLWVFRDSNIGVIRLYNIYLLVNAYTARPLLKLPKDWAGGYVHKGQFGYESHSLKHLTSAIMSHVSKNRLRVVDGGGGV